MNYKIKPEYWFLRQHLHQSHISHSLSVDVASNNYCIRVVHKLSVPCGMCILSVNTSSLESETRSAHMTYPHNRVCDLKRQDVCEVLNGLKLVGRNVCLRDISFQGKHDLLIQIEYVSISIIVNSSR